MNPRAMLAVACDMVGPLMPDRSRVMTQTKRDNQVLQVGRWALGVGRGADKSTPE